MTKAQELAQEAIEALIDESPSRALCLLTSNFVGLLCALVAVEGGNADDQIHVDGDGGRLITLHAKGYVQ